ncbi:hypothetical protein D3C80_2243020 [compost metagenome]
MVGDNIQIQVLSVEGDSIKLGFVAPKEVQILRKELYQGIAEENESAGNLSGLQIIELLKEFK